MVEDLLGESLTEVIEHKRMVGRKERRIELGMERLPERHGEEHEYKGKS